MLGKLIPCFTLLLLSLSLQAQAAGEGTWENKVDETGKTVQSLQIQAPAMTEEDQYGYNMPDRYRCDSCRAVMYHLNEAFVRKQPKSRRLQEWEYEEVFEETCRHGFKGYGIKLVNGENTLSGPALQHAVLQPGMGAIQMGGETWEKRLGEICRKIVYDKIGEDVLYAHFHSDGKLSPDLCLKETKDCQLGPKAPVAATMPKPQKGKISKGAKQTKKGKNRSGGKKQQDDRHRENEQLPTGNDAAPKDESVDVRDFLARLARKHGIPVAEYTKDRDCKEWERVLVKAAGRIFEHSDSHDKDLFL